MSSGLRNASDRLRHVEALNRYSGKSVKGQAICLKDRTYNEHAIITSLDLIKAAAAGPALTNSKPHGATRDAPRNFA